MIDPALATDDESVALELLERYDLAVHPGYLYGLETPATLVLSYLAPPQVLEEGAARLGRYLASH
jgi:aspartate/methionine/tyrosine aminotransferase